MTSSGVIYMMTGGRQHVAQDRGAWRCLVMEAASDLNDHKEAHEKEKKDERKKRREEGTQPPTLNWKCEEPGCFFCGVDKGGSGQSCSSEA